MKGSTKWMFGVAAGLVLVGTLLVVYAAVAQPPAAPVAPAANPADQAVPPVPGDRNAQLRDRMDQMRKLIEAGRLGGNTPVMQIAGEHIYLLYGPYLCQFAVNGLTLEAKVDLRQVLGLDQKVRDALKGRQKDRNAGQPAAPAAPAPAPEGGVLKPQ